MKKFFYASVLTLILSVFAGCTPNLRMAQEPEIDETNATINGVKYDNEVYKCWEFTWSYTVTATGEAPESESGVDYYWTTEFDAQSIKAEWDFDYNYKASFMGVSSACTGTSTLVETNKEQSECYNQ